MSKLPRDIGCSVEGCEGRTYARGLCRTHYPLKSSHYYKPRFRLGRVSCKRPVTANLDACSVRDETTGCLLWIGAKNEAGYGKYGSRRLAHRVAYEEAHGSIPDGLFVCHRCDTPRCIEPDHLFLGTTQENTADCLRKGRQGFGKLTPEQVRAIRGDPRPRRTIAKAYGLDARTVTRICNRQSWRFIA